MQPLIRKVGRRGIYWNILKISVTSLSRDSHVTKTLKSYISGTVYDRASKISGVVNYQQLFPLDALATLLALIWAAQTVSGLFSGRP